ncbi:hypothetical protein Q7P37_009869 [Cladosporium fusiforme]
MADRDIIESNVQRLAEDFQLRGCLQDDLTYAVSVMVDSSVLAAAMTEHVDLSSSLDTLLSGHPSIQAICLRGKHRILAAERVVQESDRWWMARLFDSAQEYIRHEYMHKTKLTDGEIFRRVLDAEHKCDETTAARWHGMLTARKRRNLRELKKVDGGGLLAAITPLLPFVALWVDFQPGALNRVLPMRCREEIYHYLTCIHKVWSDILGKDVFPECLDEHTVELLYLRMPAYSAHDAFHIEEALRVSTAFPAAHSDRIRRAVLGRILACEKVITFKSFHADMVLLEACYYPLRQLRLEEKGSFRQACRLSFQHDGGNFEARYVDIWLYSIRNYPRFSSVQDTGLKKGGGRGASEHLPRNQSAVAELASFAASCGFRSETIEVASAGEGHETHDDDDELPALSGGNREVCLQDRCGRPPKALFDACWWQISSKGVFAERSEPAKRHATPYAVVRSLVRSLLGFDRPYDVQRPNIGAEIKSDSSPTSTSGHAVGTTHDMQQVRTTGRLSSPCFVEPGRSSIISIPDLNLAQSGTIGESDMGLQVDDPRSQQDGHYSLIAVHREDQSGLAERHVTSTQPHQYLEETTGSCNEMVATDHDGNSSTGPQRCPGERRPYHIDGDESKDPVSTKAPQVPSTSRRRSTSIPTKATATIRLSRVTKPRQQSSTMGKRRSQELRSLRLVEMHYPNRLEKGIDHFYSGEEEIH